MRRIVGYKDGRAIWSDNVPASPGSSRLGGELVQGAPGSWEQGRINARAERARLTALRTADPEVRRATWRESKRRARVQAVIEKGSDPSAIVNGRPAYLTDAERLAARRETWRASKARKRAEAVA